MKMFLTPPTQTMFGTDDETLFPQEEKQQRLIDDDGKEIGRWASCVARLAKRERG
jgi:hypothetical protein